MRHTSPLLLAFYFLFLGNLNATTYYLDFTNGNNGNDGLSPTTAWKTLFRLRNPTPMPGDTFLLKYGEEWTGAQMYLDVSGMPGNPIVYGAYGDPTLSRPVITTVVPIMDAANSINWTETSPGSNIWTLAQGSTPGRLFLDGQEVLRARILAEVGTVDGEGARGEWFFDSGNLYLYATQNPADLYTLFSGSNNFYSALVFNASHLVFQALDFQGGIGAALSIFGGRDIIIQDCHLGHSSGTGLQLIDANVGSMRVPAGEIIVRDNFFNSNFTFFYGLGSERGVGDGIRMVFGVDNCDVYNNTFLNWAHNAVELRGDQAGGSGVNNNRIYDNHISAPDIPYAHPFGVDGLYGKCQDNEIFRNQVEDCRTVSQINGNNNRVHHNIIRGMRNSPSKTTPTAFAFALSIYGPGLVSQDNSFDHNLIIDTDEAGFQIRGFGFPIQVMNNTIRNNILINTAQAPRDDAYARGTGILIYDTNTDGVGPNTYQHNLIYNFSMDDPAMAYFQDTDTYFSAEAFNAQDGQESNTIGGHLEADPLFTDYANQDYRPRSSSPLIDAGIPTGLNLDYDLQPREQGAAPDIGPYESRYRAEPLPLISRAQLILMAILLFGVGSWGISYLYREVV